MLLFPCLLTETKIHQRFPREWRRTMAEWMKWFVELFVKCMNEKAARAHLGNLTWIEWVFFCFFHLPQLGGVIHRLWNLAEKSTAVILWDDADQYRGRIGRFWGLLWYSSLEQTLENCDNLFHWWWNVHLHTDRAWRRRSGRSRSCSLPGSCPAKANGC